MIISSIARSTAGVVFAFFAFLASTVVAQTPPTRVIWKIGDLVVPAYVTGRIITAEIDQAGPTLAAVQRWDVTGNRIRAILFAAPGCTSVPDQFQCTTITAPLPTDFALPPLAPGEYVLEVTNSDELLDKPPQQTRVLSVAATPPPTVVTSVGYRSANKFFISASSSEVAALTAQRQAGISLWAIAEPITMRGWPAAGPAPDAAKEVCRLFHPTAQTHFFSGNPADCAAIRGTAPWRDEGIAFRALLPAAGGVCPIGTEPVWRLFSSKFTTHRYTRSSTTYSAFQADGWSGEGVVFCSAPA